MINNIKICKNENCNKTVKGRRDRLFCSGYCKSEHHYAEHKKSGKVYFKSQVDEILRKNRAILAKYNTRNGTEIASEIMLEKGFNPRFFTHFWTNLTGETFYFCYDQGFKENKSGFGDKYTLVTWQKEMERQVFK
ncbi:MAG: hypothetical protein P8I55_14295 [Crocinitomix sp.]|nr:hypothetical protein [Crocinitomix sp.]|tara:strand:+ start:197 stop:601 length:405 start_codon:yes stop_codon:yes gene_type:complete